MSVYALTGLIFSIPISKWIQKIRMRRFLIISLSSMLSGNILSLYKPETGWYILAGRTLEGFSYTVLAITGPVIANRHAPKAYLPLVISLTAIWIPIGQLAATGITPFILSRFHWQGLWWVSIILTLLMMIWTMINPMLINSNKQVKKRSEQRHEISMSKFKQRSLLAASVIFMLWSTQYIAYMTWLPLYFIEHMGFSLGESLIGYMLPVILIIIFNILTGVAIRNGISVGTLLVMGLILQASAWWLIPLTDSGLSGILSLILYGIAAGIIATSLFAMPNTIMGKTGASAVAFGYIMTGRNIGVFIGPILLGQLYLFGSGWSSISPVFALITSLAVFTGWILSRRLKVELV